MRKFLEMLAVASMSVAGFCACDDEVVGIDVEVPCDYCVKMIEDGLNVALYGTNDAETWLTNRVYVMNLQYSGDSINQTELAGKKAYALVTIQALKKTFDAMIYTHDFGACAMSYKVGFEVTKEEQTEFFEGAKFEYEDLVARKTSAERMNLKSYVAALDTIDSIPCVKQIPLAKFGFSADSLVSDIVVNSENVQIFNQRTHDIYSGEYFIQNCTYNANSQTIDLHALFVKDQQSKYSDRWYAIAPALVSYDNSTDSVKLIIYIDGQ